MNITGTLRLRAFALALASATLVSGCASFRYTSDLRAHDEHRLRIASAILIPADNATDDESAGKAITEMLGTALYERGIPIYQTESSRLRASAPKAAGADGRYEALVKETGATHLIFATVHEYRYKTDLDGDPAVGVTVRIVDAKSGLTVWQGSSGNVGYVFASLSSSAQYSLRRLVARIPLDDTTCEPKDAETPATTPAEAPAPAAR